MQIKKISFIILAIFCFTANSVFANSLSKNINKTISDSNINKDRISISIKALETKKTIYSLNDGMPIPPASIQKIVTSLPALKTLGDDYKFETSLYKESTGNYIIKLGADPYLKSADLTELTKKLPSEIKSLSIDSTVIDSKEWGEGWQWDDSMNPYMPKFSAYNIDRNTLMLTIEPTKEDTPAIYSFEKEYPVLFVNLITTGNELSYKIEKYLSEDSRETIVASGIISKPVTICIPVNNPKRYFKLRLTDALLDNEVSNNGIYNSKKVSKNSTLISKISHDISNIKADILLNSDNYVTETIFKLAGGKYKKTTGTFENGLEMLHNYYDKLYLDYSMINIVDASGVSKNNLMIADFMTDCLIINRNDLEPILATAGSGTLADRMLYLKGNLKAKTGTLSNISSLAGYISTQNGHKYAFCIMINDSKSSSSEKKQLEDNIIKELYLKG